MSAGNCINQLSYDADFPRRLAHRPLKDVAHAKPASDLLDIGRPAFDGETRIFFPGRIRYTSVSVPYHIGNGWGGGLVPFITTAAFQSTGSLGYALIYPIAVPAICFVLSLFLMPETGCRDAMLPLVSS